MVSVREQYSLVAAAIDDCGSYELAYVSPALENLFQRKYRFQDPERLYSSLDKRGFKNTSDIQTVIDKVKERRG